MPKHNFTVTKIGEQWCADHYCSGHHYYEVKCKCGWSTQTEYPEKIELIKHALEAEGLI